MLVNMNLQYLLIEIFLLCDSCSNTEDDIFRGRIASAGDSLDRDNPEVGGECRRAFGPTDDFLWGGRILHIWIR